MATPEDVTEILKLLRKSGANAEYFFNELDDPSWIEPLTKHGFFTVPPEPQFVEGSVGAPFWPESRYLVRMAERAEARDTVLKLASEFAESGNARVYEDVAAIALVVGPDQASSLVPKLREGLRQRYLFALPERVTKVVAHLAVGGETSAALALAADLLDVRRVYGVDPDWVATTGTAVFDNGLYSHLLELVIDAVAEADKCATLHMFCDALERGVNHDVGALADDTEEHIDFSSVWAPVVRAGLKRRYDFKQSLLEAVLHAAQRLAEEGAEELEAVITELEGRRWSVFWRIAIHLVHEWLPRTAAEAARYVLNREWFDEPSLDAELKPLLGACFGSLSGDEKARVFGWIDEGPNYLNTSLGGREGHSVTQPEIDETRNRIMRDHYSLLSSDLDDERRERLQDLLSSQGAAASFDADPRVSFWVGPRSDLGEAALNAMPLADLIAHLQDWTPTGEFDGASMEGLARELKKTVTRRAAEFLAASESLRKLDPTYVRAIVNGLREAARGEALDWPSVLDLFGWAVTQEREEAKEGVLGRDRDPGWGWTRMSIASMLNELLAAAPSPFSSEVREKVWSIIRPLTDDPDPTREFSESSGLAPVAASLNTVRGVAMRAVVSYARWCEALSIVDDKVVNGETVCPEAFAVLDERLDPAREPSPAVRAVIGESFWVLLQLAPAWAKQNLDRIFVDQQTLLGAAAWSAYLDFTHPDATCYAMLNDRYRNAVMALQGKETATSYPENQPGRRLGEHLMAFVGKGDVSIDDGVIEALFTNASGRLRGSIVATSGQALFDYEGVLDPPVQERLLSFWRWRIGGLENSWADDAVEEVSWFGLWFASGQFGETESLEMLARGLALSRRVEPDDKVVECLSRLADRHTELVLHQLRSMIEADQGWGVSSWGEHAHEILETALEEHRPKAVRRQAISIANSLGTRGHGEFRALARNVIGSEK